VGVGDGLDSLGGTAAYRYVPCISAKIASCSTHLQTPVYKWNSKAGKRVGERQQQLGIIHDHSWFCKDLANWVGISPGFSWSE